MDMTKTLNLPSERLPTFGASTVKEAALKPTDPIPGAKGGKIKWVGNATCIVEYGDIRFMTDPNFLHQGITVERSGLILGDHVHLGPGVTGTRLKDPAFPYTECPPVDFICIP